MAEWKIRRRQGTCSACERAFEDGERHASLLRIEGEEIQRLDCCAACWRARADGAEGGGGAVLWWFTRHQTARRRTFALDLAALERLFLELEGREEQRLREVRYLLCLLLMRKKRLRLERVQRGRAGEALVVRRPRRKEELVVHVFEFSAERLDELRTHLQEILEGAGPVEDEAGEEGGEEGAAEGAGASGDEAGAAWTADDWDAAAAPLTRGTS